MLQRVDTVRVLNHGRSTLRHACVLQRRVQYLQVTLEQEYKTQQKIVPALWFRPPLLRDRQWPAYSPITTNPPPKHHFLPVDQRQRVRIVRRRIRELHLDFQVETAWSHKPRGVIQFQDWEVFWGVRYCVWAHDDRESDSVWISVQEP